MTRPTWPRSGLPSENDSSRSSRAGTRSSTPRAASAPASPISSHCTPTAGACPWTLTRNVASQRVLERAGFVRYGTAPDYLQIDGRWQEHAIYQCIAPE